MSSPVRLGLLSIATLAGLLTGCGSGPVNFAAAAGADAGLSGSVHGGQQPVTGASLQLYAASLTGMASASTPLLTSSFVTDSNGNFNITGGYTCPATPTLVYLVATGGNPGLASGTNNPYLKLMAPLGLCSSLSASTQITVNEITTVAAAWALAPFSASANAIGATPTNFQGLSNAFNNALLLADTTRGNSPGSLLPGNATVESAKVKALANAISACVNSNGGAACTALFSAASITPGDTFTAALGVVQHPARNVAAVYNLITPDAPFGGALTAAPSDWSMSMAVTGGGLSTPTALGINSKGQPWVIGFNGVLSGFTPQGSPLLPNGVSGAGLVSCYGLTIDGNDSIWAVSRESAFNINSGYGLVARFNAQGQITSGSNGFSGGNIYFPEAAAATPAGLIWVVDNGNSRMTVLGPDGSPVPALSNVSSNSLSFPNAVAIDTDQSAWVANQGGSTLTHLGANGADLGTANVGQGPSGLAIDPRGYIWSANYFSNSVAQVFRDETVVSTGYTGGGLRSPQAIAIDGNGTVWVANYRGNTLSELAGSAAAQPGLALSPGTGLGKDALLSEPYAIAIDGSGTLWTSSEGTDRLYAFIGLAAPVKTPLLGPAQLP